MSLLGEEEGGGGNGAQQRRTTAGIQELQGGDGLRRGKWHSLDFAEITRNKDTVGQGDNCAETFLLCSVCTSPTGAFHH